LAGSPLGGFAVGERIAGYVLEEQIGRGGMAVVFRAHDERLDRTVALKILAPGLADDEAFRQRFIRESRAAAAVDDPHIIPVFEAGEASGALFIAMRYISGGDVGAAAQRAGRLQLEEVAAIVSQVASALDAAHARGLVHRDVKPTNMLLDAGRSSGRPDHVYLSDFGLSKPQMTAAKITATGQFLGTLDYVSPEQLSGQPVGAACDQYSLACAAFELLSGTAPFERDTGMAVMYAHIHDTPPSLTSRRSELPEALDAVFVRALAKAPANRFESCQEFAEAMRAALGLPSYRSQHPPRAEALEASVPPEGSEAQPATTDSPLPVATEVADITGSEFPVTVASARTSAPTAGAAALDAGALAAQVSTGPLQVSDGAAESGSGRPWWRSRALIGAAVAVLVALGGGGVALLLNGGNATGPSGAVIFQSDFSGAADGWQVVQSPGDGSVSNGSYYVSATTSGNGEIGVPTGASSVYPSAPADVRIDVTARGSRGPMKDIQYGLVCRHSGGSSYVFGIQGRKLIIGKLVSSSYSQLASTSSSTVDVSGANQLTAICQSVAGQQAVRLAFAVNGRQFLSLTDRTNPLSSGTVGVFTNFYGVSIANGVTAAFQNFVVRQL
jgi:serine/threonine protein kinase